MLFQKADEGVFFARRKTVRLKSELTNINLAAMKKIIPLLAFILILIFSESFSKESKLDSLLIVLKTAKEDTNKVNTLNVLFREYLKKGDIENQKKTAYDAFSLAEKINFKKGIATSYLSIGIYYFYQSNYPEALKNYKDALKVCEEIKNTKGIAHSYNNMALIYDAQGNYSEALRKFSGALKAYEELKDTMGMSRCYNNIGIVYDNQGNYPEALKSYFAALKIQEQAGNKEGMANLYLNIGLVYSNQENIRDALKYYSASLKLCEEIDFKQGIANCYGNMAIAHRHDNDLSQALEYNSKSVKIYEEMGNKASAAMGYNSNGNIYSDQGNYAGALKNYLIALKIFQEIGDSLHTAVSYIDLGSILGKQGKIAEAIDYFNKGLVLSTKIGAKDRIESCYQGLSEAYKEKNDFKNAYKYHELFYQLHDSIFNESKSKQITEMNTKYETEKKDNEIVLLNKDKEVKNAEIRKQTTLKYSFIGGLAVLALLSLIVFNNIRVRNKLKLQTLRNKIASDLHDDVGSTLSSIAIFSEVAQQQSKEVIPMLNTIGESARKMLDAMADIVWTINPENDNFEKIILRMRSFAYELLGAKKIEFEFEADDDASKKKLPMDVRKNLYLIFKEATNNMVKYSEANKASFSIKGGKNELTMLIRDNGKGFDTAKETIGNGLKNMKKRAEEIGAKLLIESMPGSGTTIQLLVKTA